MLRGEVPAPGRLPSRGRWRRPGILPLFVRSRKVSIRKIGAAMTSTEAPPRPRVVQTLRRVNRLVQQAGDPLPRQHRPPTQQRGAPAPAGEPGPTVRQGELPARLSRAEAPVDQARLACGLHVTPPTLTALVD